MLTIMEVEKLDRFSRYMYELFTVNYPQFAKYIKNMPEHEEAFVVEIPSPSRVKYPLIIYTVSQEITVCFDNYHKHIGFPDVPYSDAFSQAKDLIDSIIENRILVASKICYGKLRSVTKLNASELVEFEINNLNYNRIVGWEKTYLDEDDFVIY
jgi:hypothetical protein